MTFLQGAVLGAQLVVLVFSVLALRRTRDMAIRAGLAYAQAKASAEWAERAAACVPFPRRSSDVD